MKSVKRSVNLIWANLFFFFANQKQSTAYTAVNECIDSLISTFI